MFNTKKARVIAVITLCVAGAIAAADTCESISRLPGAIQSSPSWTVIQKEGIQFAAPFAAMEELPKNNGQGWSLSVWVSPVYFPSRTERVYPHTLSVWSFEEREWDMVKDWTAAEFLEKTTAAEDRTTSAKDLLSYLKPVAPSLKGYDDLFRDEVISKYLNDFDPKGSLASKFGNGANSKFACPTKSWGINDYAAQAARLKGTDTEIYYAVFMNRAARRIYRLSVANSAKPGDAIALLLLMSSTASKQP